MSLLQSRKFLLLLADAIFSLATYFIGKYAGASSQDLLTVLAILQPVWVAVIVGVTVDDTIKVWAGVRREELAARVR